MLSRGTRAKHAYPIEIALPPETSAGTIDVVIEGAVVRMPASTGVDVIASLVRALREPTT
jgi:hypothetical protein